MKKVFPLIMLSQFSNFAPLAAFLAFSGTGAYARYVYIIFLAQVVAVFLVARLEIQLQVERWETRRLYFLALSLECLLISGCLSLLLAYMVFGIGEVSAAVLLACAMAALSIGRSHAMGTEGLGNVVRFETLNVLVNAVSFGLSFLVPATGLLHLFLGARIAQAALVCAGLVAAMPGKPGLSHVLRLRRRRYLPFRRAGRVLKFSFPVAALAILSSRLPILALESALPPATLAGFLAANRLSLSPLSLLLYGVRIAAVKEIAKARRGRPNRFRALLRAVACGTPIMLLPMLFPDLLARLVPVAVDGSWRHALEFLPLMYPLSVLFMMTGWLDRVFDMRGQQGDLFRVEIVILGLTFLLCAAIWAGPVSGVLALKLVIWLAILQSVLWLAAFLIREFGPPARTGTAGA